jgi:hypothetical protein
VELIIKEKGRERKGKERIKEGEKDGRPVSV